MVVSDINNSHGVGPIKRPPAKLVESPKTQKPSVQGDVVKTDRLDMNQAARIDAQMLHAAKLVLDTLPDVRQDKVDQARKRLDKGFYDKAEVRLQIAKKLLQDPEVHLNINLTEQQTETIKNRLNTGFYEQSDIKDSIASDMVDDALESED